MVCSDDLLKPNNNRYDDDGDGLEVDLSMVVDRKQQHGGAMASRRKERDLRLQTERRTQFNRFGHHYLGENSTYG